MYEGRVLHSNLQRMISSCDGTMPLLTTTNKYSRNMGGHSRTIVRHTDAHDYGTWWDLSAGQYPRDGLAEKPGTHTREQETRVFLGALNKKMDTHS